jgi:antitoxin VapB
MITLPPEIEQLARRVAARSGRTPEDIVKQGVETEARIAGIAIEEAHPRKEVDVERVREIVREVSSAPLLDRRTPKEILDEAWGDPA